VFHITKHFLFGLFAFEKVTFYDSIVALQALILTFALFVGLSLFTIQSKKDFSGMGPFLFGALWIIIIASFIQIFLPFNRSNND